jgi:hypothetical protein
VCAVSGWSRTERLQWRAEGGVAGAGPGGGRRRWSGSRRREASLERVPEEGGGEPVESPSTAPRARLVPRLLETRATAAAAAQARRLVHASR